MNMMELAYIDQKIVYTTDTDIENQANNVQNHRLSNWGDVMTQCQGYASLDILIQKLLINKTKFQLYTDLKKTYPSQPNIQNIYMFENKKHET